ncbi:VOC family protein [Streptomyces sp. NPDC047123]|uniref:VOC family protein n=1 Tax=Streptomyces sp. NPDC047123 TaxID=3155622 RepID=UPI0033FFF506
MLGAEVRPGKDPDYVDMDEAEREAIGLGARPVDTKDNSGPRDTRVYADPAGHSFTLAAAPE